MLLSDITIKNVWTKPEKELIFFIILHLTESVILHVFCLFLYVELMTHIANIRLREVGRLEYLSNNTVGLCLNDCVQMRAKQPRPQSLITI